MSLATTNYAVVSPCANHRRDAFYKINNKSSHVLVLGRIDLQLLSNDQLRRIFNTTTPKIEILKFSTSLILVIYITDEKGNLRKRNKNFSVIDVNDCPHLPPLFLDPNLSGGVNALACEIINSITYISEQTKRFLTQGPLGFAKNAPSPNNSALHHQPQVAPMRTVPKMQYKL